MDKLTTSEDVDHHRRRLFGAAAASIAAAQLGMNRLAHAQSSQRAASMPTIKPGTNTSFRSLNQINAGEGDDNGAPHLGPSAYANKFTGKYAHRTITGGIGHNLPQEAPQSFAAAVVDLAEG